MGIEINGQAIESIKMNGEDILQLLVNGLSVWKKEIPSPYYAFDDFNRTTLGTKPVVGPNYIEIGPKMKITDNQLTAGSDNEFLLFERPSTHWKIEVNGSRYSTNSAFGVALGYSDTGNRSLPQFFLGWQISKLVLVYYTYPMTTTLKSVSLTIPQTYKLEVEANGNLVNAWLDGELKITHRITQTTNLHSKIGLYGRGKADSFYCYDLSSTTL